MQYMMQYIRCCGKLGLGDSETSSILTHFSFFNGLINSPLDIFSSFWWWHTIMNTSRLPIVGTSSSAALAPILGIAKLPTWLRALLRVALSLLNCVCWPSDIWNQVQHYAWTRMINHSLFHWWLLMLRIIRPFSHSNWTRNNCQYKPVHVCLRSRSSIKYSHVSVQILLWRCMYTAVLPN